MKITVDTNILLRDALRDDPRQSRVAEKILQEAELVAIPVSVFLRICVGSPARYKKPARDVAEAISRLMRSASVATNRIAVEAGLRMLDAGGDFADGAIAYEGEWLGAAEFVSFDREAVSMLKAQGKRARLLV